MIPFLEPGEIAKKVKAGGAERFHIIIAAEWKRKTQLRLADTINFLTSVGSIIYPLPTAIFFLSLGGKLSCPTFNLGKGPRLR